MSDIASINPGGRNARIGLVLFAIYVVLYGGFILLAALRPEAMDLPTAWGLVNLAILYGMGLILAALVLALVYLLLCHSETYPPKEPQ